MLYNLLAEAASDSKMLNVQWRLIIWKVKKTSVIISFFVKLSLSYYKLLILPETRYYLNELGKKQYYVTRQDSYLSFLFLAGVLVGGWPFKKGFVDTIPMPYKAHINF